VVPAHAIRLALCVLSPGTAATGRATPRRPGLGRQRTRRVSLRGYGGDRVRPPRSPASRRSCCAVARP